MEMENNATYWIRPIDVYKEHKKLLFKLTKDLRDNATIQLQILQ